MENKNFSATVYRFKEIKTNCLLARSFWSMKIKRFEQVTWAMQCAMVSMYETFDFSVFHARRLQYYNRRLRFVGARALSVANTMGSRFLFTMYCSIGKVLEGSSSWNEGGEYTRARIQRGRAYSWPDCELFAR